MDFGQDAAIVGEVDGLAGGQPVSDGQHVLKFEVQLYKVRDNEYVVDFQVRNSLPARLTQQLDNTQTQKVG